MELISIGISYESFDVNVELFIGWDLQWNCDARDAVVAAAG
jgi:hypothetical protein